MVIYKVKQILQCLRGEKEKGGKKNPPKRIHLGSPHARNGTVGVHRGALGDAGAVLGGTVGPASERAT